MNRRLMLKRSNIDSSKVLLICVLIFLYCPFFYIETLGDYCGDTAIQIKVGLDSIANGNFIPVEIYSWHENLNWVMHGVLWYFSVGFAYKVFGIFGVIGLAAVLNYSIAGLAFRFNSKVVHPIVLILTAGAARILSFPNYLARPNLVSQLALVYLLYVLLGDNSIRRKCITFVVLSALVSWFHGGMLLLFYVSFLIFIVIELIFKNYETIKSYFIALTIGFSISFLNPAGYEIWLYPFKGASLDFIQEWFPKNFSTFEILVILLAFIGFGVDERLRNFDKNTIIRLCFLSMFVMMSCQHGRFMNYTALIILLFCAEQYQILFDWINSNVLKINKKNFQLSSISHYIICAFCIGFALFASVSAVTKYFPTNSMSDCSAIAAYDEEVIRFIKTRGYNRIYNNFDTGTWLAFYDVPVHIDNRTDLYLEQYSGEDYITGQAVASNIRDIDNFYYKYSPDAFVLDLIPGTTDDYILLDMHDSDKYTLVYANTIVSTYNPETVIRWVVFECNY